MRQHRPRGLWGNFRKLIWKLPGWVFSARSSPDLVNKCCKAVIGWKSTDRCLLIQKRLASVGPKKPASQKIRKASENSNPANPARARSSWFIDFHDDHFLSVKHGKTDSRSFPVARQARFLHGFNPFVVLASCHCAVQGSLSGLPFRRGFGGTPDIALCMIAGTLTGPGTEITLETGQLAVLEKDGQDLPGA